MNTHPTENQRDNDEVNTTPIKKTLFGRLHKLLNALKLFHRPASNATERDAARSRPPPYTPRLHRSRNTYSDPVDQPLPHYWPERPRSFPSTPQLHRLDDHSEGGSAFALEESTGENQYGKGGPNHLEGVQVTQGYNTPPDSVDASGRMLQRYLPIVSVNDDQQDVPGGTEVPCSDNAPLSDEFGTINQGNDNLTYNRSHVTHEDNQGSMHQNFHLTLPPSRPPPPSHSSQIHGISIPADCGSCGQHYTRLMLTAGEGYPLWCPQPEERLPPLPQAYIQSGIRIGDIGIIHADKPFDFLFNITVPKEDPSDPINEMVPIDFTPMEKSGLEFTYMPIYRQKEIHVSGPTYSWHRTNLTQGPRRGYRFVLNQREAALLMLPEGSSYKALKTKQKFLQFAKKNGRDWIKHAMTDREREVYALYLVTAREHCPAWGMASLVSRSSENTAALPFIIHANTTYEWGHYKGCESKAFPGSGNTEENLRNQSVFIWGYRISLCHRGVSWSKKKIIVEPEPDDFGGQWGPGRNSPSTPGSSTSNGSGSKSAAGQDYSYSGQTTSSYSLNVPGGMKGRAIFGKLIHPCDIINTLLHAIAEKTLDDEKWDGIAISHDDDWIVSTRKLGAPLSPYSIHEFLRVVLKNIPFTIDREHNAIYTELPDELNEPRETGPLEDIIGQVAEVVIGRYCTWFEVNEQPSLMMDTPVPLVHIPASGEAVV